MPANYRHLAISHLVIFCSTMVVNNGIDGTVLEDESSSELNLAFRTFRCRANAERRSTERSARKSKRGVVKDVEKLSSKLHFEEFGDLRIFYQRRIVVPPRRPRDAVSA